MSPDAGSIPAASTKLAIKVPIKFQKMEDERIVASLSHIFLRRIEQEINKMDEAGVLVNEELLAAFRSLLKKEMHKYEHLPTFIIDKAIDVAFCEIIKQRSVKH